jgi:hypothetical protein
MGVIRRYYIRDAETNELWCIPSESLTENKS